MHLTARMKAVNTLRTFAEKKFALLYHFEVRLWQERRDGSGALWIF